MGELEKLRGHDCETKSFKRLAFPDPVQRREHPVSCRSIPQHTWLWRIKQPGWYNSQGIPKKRESKQKLHMEWVTA